MNFEPDLGAPIRKTHSRPCGDSFVAVIANPQCVISKRAKQGIEIRLLLNVLCILFPELDDPLLALFDIVLVEQVDSLDERADGERLDNFLCVRITFLSCYLVTDCLPSEKQFTLGVRR